MIPVLLLGDGNDDVGRQPGVAGAPLPEKKWGPLHVLVAFALRESGLAEFVFVRPRDSGSVARDGVSRNHLPRDLQLRQQFLFFLDTIRAVSKRGLVVVINDQDCETRRQEWLDRDVDLATRGLLGGALIAVTAVAVECTESWLLCGVWPALHQTCVGVAHPRLLGCENNKNRAKHVFDQLHGGGWQPRRQMAKQITRHAQTAACKRLREAEDFRLLEGKLEDALLRLWYP